MLGVRENFGTKEGDDVIRDHLNGFGGEIVIVDTEEAVEPMNFICNKFTGNEAL